MVTQSASPPRAGKYVTFQIARHYFALEARRVLHVVPLKEVRPVEGPSVASGIVRINGQVIPVIDIRHRLALPSRSSQTHSAVLLTQLGPPSARRCIGIIADRLTDVLEVRERDFRENVIQPRSFGRPYGRPKTLLDIEALIRPEELAALEEFAGRATLK